MKFFAIILSFFILSLAAFPAGNSVVEEKQHSCCKKEMPEKKSKSNDCCNNGCNPFVNCCGMMGFVPFEKSIELLLVVQMVHQKIDFYQAIHSIYLGDIWQPPKV